MTRCCRSASPLAPCIRVNDLFDDEHMLANDRWWDCDHPQRVCVRQTGRVIRWDEMQMSFSRRAPLLGEHTEECLRELGCNPL